ncbi:hypothetical protein GCU56_04715 [Geodermatophilus sabuli]|uniref:Uncharacterized protein n=1 Tax=Geodermatophilus sabuli TaxID=1564158 RepID=A0A7K3VWZ7_9ACTN|nr:hypothetical protein [Geodermatophilus sabuli]NEK57175.1 hypothetical protein [Geodermatophilus sabuli]
MSGMTESRAVVFTQLSQHVEVCVDATWWPGVILGWRHDARGACQVRVRAVVAGAEREAWTDLAELRLPEPARDDPARDVPARAPAPAEGHRGRGGSTDPAPPTVTLHRASARERLVADVLAAPEYSSEAGAPTAADHRRRRRRHGGDVTAELPAVRSGIVPGRHRAPAVPGRHRAVDEVPAEPPSDAPRAEADCMTRPLRLGDRVPRPRLPRPDAVGRA